VKYYTNPTWYIAISILTQGQDWKRADLLSTLKMAIYKTKYHIFTICCVCDTANECIITTNINIYLFLLTPSTLLHVSTRRLVTFRLVYHTENSSINSKYIATCFDQKFSHLHASISHGIFYFLCCILVWRWSKFWSKHVAMYLELVENIFCVAYWSEDDPNSGRNT
jgi:hypothetical protein